MKKFRVIKNEVYNGLGQISDTYYHVEQLKPKRGSWNSQHWVKVSSCGKPVTFGNHALAIRFIREILVANQPRNKTVSTQTKILTFDT